jgi:hypothetical protein
MATIPTTSGAVYMSIPRRSYMATRSFEDDFYSYTTSINPTTFARVGTLAPVTADATKCPQGRILRENGRKLYPGAYPGVTEYMVGVYDAQTGLSGFINPNSAVFLVLNGDKPEYLPQGSETDDGTFTGLNHGQPVFTHGSINAGADMDISGDGTVHGDMNVGQDLDVDGYIAAGEYVQATGNIITTGGIITSQPVYTTTGNTTITIDVSQYSNAFVTINGATQITVTGVSAGRTLDLVILASGGNHALTFNTGPIYSGNSFNRTLNSGTRLGLRLVAMTGSQMYPIADSAY